MINWLRQHLTQKFVRRDSSGKRVNIAPLEGVHPARMEHLGYVLESIFREASQGHFSPQYLDIGAESSIKAQVATSIAFNQCLTHLGFVADSFFFVFLENDDPVGFYWVAALEEDRLTSYEIALIAVSPQHRNRKIGEALLLDCISRLPKGTRFEARLYPESMAMLRMMTKIGFKRSLTESGNTIRLIYFNK